MAVEQGGTLESNLRIGPQSGQTKDRRGGMLVRFAFWRDRGKERPEETFGRRDTESTEPPKDLLLPDAHKITDVLSNLTEQNPITNLDILEIMRWAKHPEVARHVYQLEGGDEELYRGGRRKSMYIDYYQGWKDDEGRSTKPEDSIFLKAVNRQGRMLANSRLRAKGVPYILKPRTMGWERLLVVPELLGKKIGLGFSLEVLDTAFYKYEGYDGLPAEELRGSIYVDIDAAKNFGLLSLLGFEGNGPARRVNNGRWIQPMRVFPSRYKEVRPRALDHLGHDQPEWAEHLEKTGVELQNRLNERGPISADGDYSN